MSKIRALVIDDSPMVRKLITAILDADPDIEVVGSAADPIIARRKIKQLNPDVLTLDVEMPNMDGITFLRKLMRLRPMPVVMVSTLTEKGADTTLEALEIGAVGYVAKPKVDLANRLGGMEVEIVREVKLAARSRVRSADAAKGSDATARLLAPPTQPAHSLVAIGASTGGVGAIGEVLAQLPVECPPVVVTQHIAEDFSARFAMRLDKQIALTVCEARDAMEIKRGHVYIAPGSHHLEVRRSPGPSGGRMICHLKGGEKVSRHRPSVDVLFRSVATHIGSSAMGVLLTGMGEDGASGLAEMKNAGCYTIAQDEATSVVWGMPGTAVKLDAVKDVLPLTAIPARLLSPLEP